MIRNTTIDAMLNLVDNIYSTEGFNEMIIMLMLSTEEPKTRLN